MGDPWEQGGQAFGDPDPWTGPPEDWNPDALPPDWDPNPPPRGVRTWDGRPIEAGPDHSRFDGFAIAGFVLSFLGGLVGGVLCIIALFRIGGGPGRRRGRGLAVAGLLVSVIWFMVLAVVAALVVRDALEHTNADDFSGEERRVAEVIDQAEQALEDGDALTFCVEMRTRLLQIADPDCARRVQSVRNERAGEIRIESLVIDGNRAEVRTNGGRSDIAWSLERVDGVWLLDDVV